MSRVRAVVPMPILMIEGGLCGEMGIRLYRSRSDRVWALRFRCRALTAPASPPLFSLDTPRLPASHRTPRFADP